MPQLANMSLIVSRLINRLRGDPPSYENNQSIPPNSNQTLQIVVDDLADNLQTTLIWNTSGNPSANLFTLTSPSGVVYNQPEYFGTSTLKYAIDAPESGVWFANITNNYSTTQTYSIISEVDSDLTVTVEEIPAMHQVDTPLLLKVSVSDYDTPISSATVSAQLKRGAWQFSVELYDDGCHNDGNAGDGLYGNYLYAYAEMVNVFPSYQQFGDFDLSIIVDIPSINGRRVVNQNLYLNPAQPNSYPQVTRDLHKGWNWVGYPRLQRDEVGTSIDYANASLSPFLTDIMSIDGIAEYRDNQWSYYGLSSLKSEPGYKLRINETTSVRLFELGTIIDTLMVHQLNEGQWNWVTYPCYETVYPWEALSGVIDRIDYIMAEDWSMKKDGDVWIYDGFSRPHLKYGDSMMIQTVRDCEFVWNNPLTTPIIVDPRKPTYFVYEDKPNYETIMIESIEGNPDYAEIGVFQDDVCIGARVNEAYPIQILAYSTPVEEGGGPLSFMLYSESKGLVLARPATINSGNYIANEPTLEPERYGFRVLTLKTNDQQMPSALALHSNYPNPFNPSTTINFSLPKTAPVRLVIYNIRGQKVKELLNESLAGGNHNVVWNGRDDGNRPVASGVYFTRLEQSGV
ncbi:MAG: T9SS type A sorting domain-containing protein, partial [Candidatus Cloacimonadaceae bacterium]